MAHGKKVARVKATGRHDIVPGVIALSVTVMVALAALTPYVVVLPEKNLNLITQEHTTLWNGWLVILGFYFGSTHSKNSTTRKADDDAAAN